MTTYESNNEVGKAFIAVLVTGLLISLVLAMNTISKTKQELRETKTQIESQEKKETSKYCRDAADFPCLAVVKVTAVEKDKYGDPILIKVQEVSKSNMDIGYCTVTNIAPKVGSTITVEIGAGCIIARYGVKDDYKIINNKNDN